MIYCLSNHHTGTWSTLSWLTKHRDVEGMVTSAHLFDILEKKKHYLEHLGGQIKPRWHPSMVYHEHANMDNGEPLRLQRTQVQMATIIPTVIPIRDPLASMIRYQAQAERDGRVNEPGRPHFDPVNKHINLWLRLAGTSMAIFKNFAHIKFLCWDLLCEMDRFERVEYLVKISKCLGLNDAEPSVDCAREMIRENDYGSYPLKEAYKRGDLDYIGKHISEGGLAHLRKSEPALRPFLEGLGYKKLLWWSE